MFTQASPTVYEGDLVESLAGIAMHNTIDSILERADHLMYLSKKTGKNWGSTDC